MSASSSLAALYSQLRCPALVLLRTGLSLYARARILTLLQPTVAMRSIRAQLLRELLFHVPKFPDERITSIRASDIDEKRQGERWVVLQRRVLSSPGHVHFMWLEGLPMLHCYRLDRHGYHVSDRPTNLLQYAIRTDVDRCMGRDCTNAAVCDGMILGRKRAANRSYNE